MREPFQLNNPDGSLALPCIRINEDQFIELFPGLKPGQDRLHQVSFYVDDAEALRVYLAAKGIRVPERVPKGRIGNSNLSIKDPDGHTVEFVQYEPNGWTRREKGKFLPATRVSPAAAVNSSGADTEQSSPGKSRHGVRTAPAPRATRSEVNACRAEASGRKAIG